MNPSNSPFDFDSGVVVNEPEATADITDAELNQIIDARINETKGAYEKDKIDARRKRNENYWVGKHWQNQELSDDKYIDNLIYQNTEQRIKLATGKTPDIIVVPGSDELNAREQAKKVERALDIDFSADEKKRLLKNGLRHNHLYMVGIVKAAWDPSKGQYGDYAFNLVDPRKVLISHIGNIPEDGFTSDNSDIIVEIVEEPVATVLAKFPSKRAELIQALGGGADGSRLSSHIKYQEIWYTYHDRSGAIIEGTCWRYNHIILGRMKNPYFDFTGDLRPVYEQNGQPRVNQFNQVETERYFRNFFERPRKPYIFFSYQNLGKGPLDTTTAIEQAIPLQRNLNKSGKQIRDISDGITNKFAFNNKIDKGEARRVTTNTKEAIWMDTDDKISDVVMNFKNNGPPPELFKELESTRVQIDSKFQTHATARGETMAAESGVSKQITREGDLVTSDDIVDIVLDRVTEEMASWAVQFMKLMYVDKHFKSKMGKDGEVVQEVIQRDDISDGIAVTVRSSTVDKSIARNVAMTRAEAEMIDPLTLLEDLDVPNPREQTARLMLFQMGQGETGDAYARYMKFTGLDKTVQTEQEEEDMNNSSAQSGDPNDPMAALKGLMGGGQPQPGFIPEGPGTDVGQGYPPQQAPVPQPT